MTTVLSMQTVPTGYVTSGSPIDSTGVTIPRDSLGSDPSSYHGSIDFLAFRSFRGVFVLFFLLFCNAKMTVRFFAFQQQKNKIKAGKITKR